MQYKSILIKQLQGGNGTNIKPSYKGGVSTHFSDEHTDSLCSDSLVCGNSSPANPIGANGSPLATSLMEIIIIILSGWLSAIAPTGFALDTIIESNL
ncbi:hypothetical protein, partial [Spirulina sp. 06S082]|uniref:hypothetical protein n=1 Tax=Spirulina sp. 06S082 TaxID=3110248 RepID=UPI002B2137A1